MINWESRTIDSLQYKFEWSQLVAQLAAHLIKLQWNRILRLLACCSLVAYFFRWLAGPRGGEGRSRLLDHFEGGCLRRDACHCDAVSRMTARHQGNYLMTSVITILCGPCWRCSFSHYDLRWQILDTTSSLCTFFVAEAGASKSSGSSQGKENVGVYVRRCKGIFTQSSAATADLWSNHRICNTA